MNQKYLPWLWVLAVVLIVAMPVAVWGIRVLTADIKGAGDQVIQTKGNADYRIAAYDSFYDRCAAIQAKEDSIRNLQLEREAATGDRVTQIDQSITALRNTRAEQVRQYNADARKADTKAAFLASDLPYAIQITEETSCAA